MSDDIKAKRLLVLRRIIKPMQETFSSFTSLSRLRRIQSLLSKQSDAERDQKSSASTSASESAAPDTLLCVLGIDGRYNEGMAELANYLFFDFYKNNQNDLAQSGLSEEDFEDVMLVIHSDRVDFYCHPLILRHFLPYIASWKNLHIHCLRETEYNPEDEDEMEEFKIRSFIAMVEGSSVVGLPFSRTGQQKKKFDEMAIEKWPIVQAFALEGFGGGGFFTTKYQVVDFSASLHVVYQLLDPVGLEVLVTEKLVFLEKQWSSMLSLCDHIRSSNTVELREDFICEPLRSYFEHGSIGSSHANDRQENCLDWLPFVLLGENTSKSNLKQKFKGSRVNGLNQKQKEVPTHMICQSVSPRGQLRCRRTYFLKADNAVYPDDFDCLMGDNRDNHLDNDVRALVSVYKASVAAAAAAIDAFAASSDDVSQVKNSALDVLIKECELLKTPAKISSWLRDNTDVQVDHHGFRHNLEMSHVTEVVKSVVITVFDIPSLDHPGQNLGSISFADSFIHSSIQVQSRDGHVESSGIAVAITSLIPPFVTWILDEPAKQNDLRLRSRVTENQFTTAGQLLCLNNGASFSQFDGRFPAVLRNGELCVYENVVAFIHNHSGCVLLPISQLKSVSFFDGGAMNAVALVVFTYTDQWQRFLPLSLCSGNSNKIICFLLPKTKAYRSFFAKVLPSWKNHDIVKKLLTVWSELPEDLTELHHQVQEEHVITSNKTSVSQAEGFKTMKCRIPELNNLVSHLMISCAGKRAIASEHLDAVLELADYDEGGFEDSQQMILTVIAGTPGSHKDQVFASALKEIQRRDDDEWRIIRSTPDNMSEEFNRMEFQKSLELTWKELRDKLTNRKMGLKKLRGILLLPGFTDSSDFIEAIQTHPNQAVSKWIRVGAVTVCVDAMDCFMDHVYALPKFLDSCHQGWVNNIVMTNMSCEEDLLNLVQRLLRSTNSDVVFLSADKGNLSRTQDLEVVLSDSAFMTSSLIRARYLLSPGWFQGMYECGSTLPVMNQILLKLSQPLERSRLLSRLYGLKSNLKRCPFHSNIYYVRGQVCFAESSQRHDLAYATLSGHLRITSTSSGKHGTSTLDGHMLIIGCGLDERRLKDWLRECTKQRQEKPVRTRESLTQAEIRRIHKERRLEELPEGWFYNGSQFVSLDGQRSDLHPSLESFLEQYLDRVNCEVLQHNAALNKEEFKDLFD